MGNRALAFFSVFLLIVLGYMLCLAFQNQSKINNLKTNAIELQKETARIKAEASNKKPMPKNTGVEAEEKELKVEIVDVPKDDNFEPTNPIITDDNGFATVSFNPTTNNPTQASQQVPAATTNEEEGDISYQDNFASQSFWFETTNTGSEITFHNSIPIPAGVSEVTFNTPTPPEILPDNEIRIIASNNMQTGHFSTNLVIPTLN